jgi:hypothetical protein
MKPMLLAVALLVSSAPAWGTRMRPLSVEELAARAEMVARGRVVGLETLRDARRQIFTRIEVAVDEVWKGPASDGTLQIVASGGVLGDERVEIPGQAAYRVGDEIVAYLARNGRGEWVTIGLGQGRFLVSTDALTGGQTVANLFWGIEGSAAGGRTTAARAGSRAPWKRPITIDELRRRTQEAGQ